MKKIKIIIIGETASGKSTVLHIIKIALRLFGFNVTMVPDPDYDNKEETFDEMMNNSIDLRIKNLIMKSEIEIVETRLKREPKTNNTLF